MNGFLHTKINKNKSLSQTCRAYLHVNLVAINKRIVVMLLMDAHVIIAWTHEISIKPYKQRVGKTRPIASDRASVDCNACRNSLKKRIQHQVHRHRMTMTNAIWHLRRQRHILMLSAANATIHYPFDLRGQRTCQVTFRHVRYYNLTYCLNSFCFVFLFLQFPSQRHTFQMNWYTLLTLRPWVTLRQLIDR